MEADLSIETNCFNLRHTLECGQCFRWKKLSEEENIYIGVIFDRVVKIKQVDKTLFVWSNKKENLKEEIINYFDLSRDYEKIEKRIAKIDENINKAISYSSGIHILNQPIFETIISYIISANNNIKRISRSVNEISKKYGKEVIFEKEKYYLFPTLEELKNVTVEDLLGCGVGFRARYIKHDIEKFENDKTFISNLQKEERTEVYQKLISLQGVGPKVADCIMLFALSYMETFPIDVWVKRVMEKLYFKKDVSMKNIIEYSCKNFKQDAGIIQQQLFYNIREGKL